MVNPQVTNAMIQSVEKLTLALNKFDFKANASCVKFFEVLN